MRVVVFTDTLMHKEPSGRPYALRDQFVQFISPLSECVEQLVIASRCRDGLPGPDGVEFLECGDSLSYVPLPFYANTEDYYRRSPVITARALPVIWKAVRQSDVVFLRVHHCLARVVAVVARTLRRPLVVWWAGSIRDTASSNYPGRSLRDVLARMVARRRTRLYKRMARRAALNILLGARRTGLAGPQGGRVEQVVPNLVPAATVVDGPRPRGDGPLRVVFAGSIFRHKGVFDLVDAIEYLQGRQVSVLARLAGQGPLEDELRRAIEERGVSGSVALLGWLTRSELRTLLLSSDAFVLPSHAEGLPKVLWEAWAAGLAVIASDVGSVSEFLENGRNGLLIKPGDPRAIAIAIAQLAGDEETRLRLGRAGIATAREHTWEGEIEKIRKALESVHTQQRSGDVGSLKGEAG